MATGSRFALVVNRNSEHDLQKCIEGLLEFFDADRIVVLDCASTDGSDEFAKKAGVRFTKSDTNLGYGKGNNLAAKTAQKHGAEFALIINPDALIDEQNAAQLFLVLEKNPSAGAVFGMIHDRKNPEKLTPCLGKINYRHLLVEMKAPEKIESSDPVEVDFGHGCCFAVNLEAFFKAGGFDQRLFAYQDEPALCLRLKRAGYKTLLAPKAKALHKSGGKGQGQGIAKQYFIARNSLLIMGEAGTVFQRIKFYGFLAAGIIWYAAGVILGNRDYAARLQGYFDAAFKKPIRKKITELI